MSYGNKARYTAALHDCEELLRRLQNEPHVDFEVFAKVWREMTFSLIFCGRTSEDDLLEFTDDLFLAAKSCWLPPRTTTERLLASYLVYGLYFKQPAKHACKFKVTRKEWLEIAEYFNFVKGNNLPEHYYMFCKMIEGDAFSFCAVPYEVQLDRRTRRVENSSGLTSISGEMKCDVLQTLVTQGYFEKISNIEDKYKRTKKQLLKCAPELSDLLSTIATNDVGKQLRSMCLRRVLEQDDDTLTSVPVNKEVFPPPTEKIGIGERRFALKHRKIKEKEEESTWSTEEDEAGEVPKTKRRRRERGYHMVKNFRQREEMRFIQGDTNYHLHSKSSRTLHNDPLHNFMARPKQRQKVKTYKPTLEYLSQGVKLAKEAIAKYQKFRSGKEMEEEEETQSDSKAVGVSDDEEANYVLMEVGDDMSSTLSSLSLGHEEVTSTVDELKRELGSVDDDASPKPSPDNSSNSCSLDMPIL